MPWLSKRGHLNPLIFETLDAAGINRLRAIYENLRGDETRLRAKMRGRDPSPDFVLRERSLIVEIDEVQHFTSDRLTTFDHYLTQEDLAYDLEGYKRVLQRWRVKGDAYRAAKRPLTFLGRVGAALSASITTHYAISLHLRLGGVFAAFLHPSAMPFLRSSGWLMPWVHEGNPSSHSTVRFSGHD